MFLGTFSRGPYVSVIGLVLFLGDFDPLLFVGQVDLVDVGLTLVCLICHKKFLRLFNFSGGGNIKRVCIRWAQTLFRQNERTKLRWWHIGASAVVFITTFETYMYPPPLHGHSAMLMCF